MAISIKNIESSLKKVFQKSSIQSVDSVYEKITSGYSLVIDLKNLFHDETNIIFTKIIFEVDKDKTYLLENNNEYQLKYLYDINCNYKVHMFGSVNDFEKTLSSILTENKFGDNIKILSEFIKSPSSLINNWFSDNNIRNISVYDVKLNEKYKIIPCKSLFFSFGINLNNQMDINLTLRKEDKTNYIFDFKIYDDTIKEERQNLSTMVQTIGETLKTKYI